MKCIFELQNIFNERFHDFRRQEQNITFVTQPFSVETENAPRELQMELIDLQCDKYIKKKFNEIPVEKFYRHCKLLEKFPELKKNATGIISLFGSAYVCEQMFSRMKHIQSKNRSSIFNGHLEHCLRLAPTSLEADIDFLVREKQSQVAH